MRLIVAAVIVAMLLLSPSALVRAISPPTTRATTTPATTPITPVQRTRADARNPAILEAIVELTKEIEPALRNGERPPRDQSNYFLGGSDIPPSAVILALRRPLGSDVRAQAYVKWQLMSALPRELDEKTSAEILQVYRIAPAPLPRLGMEKQSRDDLERMIRNARENDAERLVEQFEQMDERVERDNLLMLKYRDALFARLPVGYDAIVAGFDDAAARINVGADAADHARALCKAVEGWAPNAPPEQLKSVSRALSQLEKKKGQEYYSRLYWSTSGKMQFTKTQGSLGRVSQLEELQEFVQDRIRNPSTPLKLKDER
jgi:hypothetical protein